jgi:hypothetical protein
MRIRLWPVAAVVALAGCGGTEKPAAAPKATPTAATQKQQAADVALRYIRAIAKHDWAGACATRTQAEQDDMARTAGSCEKGFKAILGGKPTDIFDGVEVGDVRIVGSRAGIDIVQPGQSEPATTLGAVKENGSWRLADLKDSEIP